MGERFPTIVVAENGAQARLVDLSLDDLDEGDVTIAMEWSSLNYKDTLAVTASGAVIRRFPMICGIDLAGSIVTSANPNLRPGTHVTITGCGLGEEHSGGFSGIVRAPSEWCVEIPEGLDARSSMALGTAGMTAMMSFLDLERVGSGPDELDGLPLVVTGAAGGVGSLAVLIGARLGYEVIASTGRSSESEFLKRLGAAQIIDRSELSDAPLRPLSRARFGAAVDVVGGTTLANVLCATRPSGAVAASGLVGGVDLPTSVHPFILRGVTLAGVNTAAPQMDLRRRAWMLLAEIVPLDLLEELTTQISLSDVSDRAPDMLTGSVRGRVVVEGPTS